MAQPVGTPDNNEPNAASFCPSPLVSLKIPLYLPPIFRRAAFQAYLDDADISDVPDAHALQAFDRVAERLCAKGLAIRHHAANHARISVALEADGEAGIVYRPGTALAEQSSSGATEANGDPVVRIRFPDAADFLDVLSSYMQRDVPGELWLAGEGPAFDTERDFALLQRLRAVREAMSLRQANLWQAFIESLSVEGRADGEGGRVRQCWDRWLWLVEEMCQINFLLKREAAASISCTLPDHAAWRRLRGALDVHSQAEVQAQRENKHQRDNVGSDDMVVVTRPAAAAELGMSASEAFESRADGVADGAAATQTSTAAPAFSAKIRIVTSA